MYRECIGFHLNFVGNHAKIKTTYEKINGVWYPAIPEDFLPNSTVFDYFPRQELVLTYQLCYFLCEDNKNKRKSSDDDFIVVRDSHEFLYKILDYSYVSIDQARKKLYFDGVYLDDEKGTTPRTLYIYLKQDILVQLNFTYNSENERWYADYSIDQSESKNLIESYLLKDGLNNKSIFNFKNNRYLLSDEIKRLEPLGVIDWSADYSFYEKTLANLLKLGKESSVDIQLSSFNDIKKLISFLQVNEVFPDVFDGNINKIQYLDRLLEGSSNTNFVVKAYNQLYEKLASTIEFESFVANKVDEVVKEQSKEILKDVLHSVEVENSHLKQDILKEAEKQQHDNNLLTNINDQLKTENLALTSSINELKILIDQFINEAVSLSINERNVIDRLNNILINKKILQEKSLLPDILPPWSISQKIRDIKTIDVIELDPIFSQLAYTYGYQKRNVVVFDRLLRTNHLILLINKHAHLFIEQYSRFICGGRLSYISMDASFIGLDDLWRSPVTQLPTAFAYAWHNAINNPQDYYIVHLTGVLEIGSPELFNQLNNVLMYPNRPKNLLVVCSLTSEIENLDNNQKELLKKVNTYLLPLKFNFSNINAKIALQSLDKNKCSQIIYSEDPKRYIQIINIDPKNYQNFHQIERLYSLSDFPEVLFKREQDIIVCEEQLEAQKVIKEL